MKLKDNQLLEYFQDVLISEYSVRPTDAKKISRYCLYVFFCAAGGTAGLPLLKVAQEYAENNKILAILYSYGFTVSLGALNIWGLFDFTKYLDASTTINKGKSNKTKFLKPFISGALGFFTALSLAPLNYYYNKNIFFVSQGIVSDTALLSCTYQQILISNTFNFNNDKYTKQAFEVMQLLLNQMNIGAKSLINLPASDRNKFLKRLKYGTGNSADLLIVSIEQIKQAILELINMSNIIALKKEKNTSFYKKIPRFILKYPICLMTPVLWAYTSFTVSSKGLTELIKNSTVSKILIAPSTTVLSILEILLIQVILLGIYDALKSLFKGTFQRNLPLLEYPLPLLLVMLWGVFTASLSFSTRAKIVDDNFSEPYDNYLVALIITITIIVKSSSFLSLIYDVAHELIKRYARDEMANIGKFISALNKFNLSLDVANKELIVQFIEELNEDLIVTSGPETNLNKAALKFKKIMNEERPTKVEPVHFGRFNFFKREEPNFNTPLLMDTESGSQERPQENEEPSQPRLSAKFYSKFCTII